jgi:hypothetical protein
LRRNVRQVWLGERAGPRQRYRRIERLLTTMLSLSNSPRIRSVPHSRLSRDMVAIRSRTSGLRCGRPPRERDFQRHNRRQSCRCQRTTVSGVTKDRCSRASRRRIGERGSTAACPARATWLGAASELGASAPPVDAAAAVLGRRGRAAGVLRRPRSCVGIGETRARTQHRGSAPRSGFCRPTASRSFIRCSGSNKDGADARVGPVRKGAEESRCDDLNRTVAIAAQIGQKLAIASSR